MVLVSLLLATPLLIQGDETVKVDTRTGDYLGRVKG